MVFLIKTLQLIISLSVLVVVHEFGHYLFARLFGVRVDKFYMFFNYKFSIFRAKKIDGKWQVKFFAKNPPDNWVQALNPDGTPKVNKKGKPVMVEGDPANLPEGDWRRYPETTEWGIGWIPFGGYCSIVGMVDETTSVGQLSAEPQPWEFRSKKAWQRLLMIAGGVLFNFVFAMIIYAMLLFKNGEEYLPVENATLGYDYCQTALDHGFQKGDKILTIDGVKPEDAKDVVEMLIIEGKRNVVVDRNGEQVAMNMTADLGKKMLEAEEKGFMSPRIPFVVDDFASENAAARKALQIGDSVVGVNSIENGDAQEIMQEITANAGKPIALKFYRDGNLMTDSLTPNSDGKIGAQLRHPYKIFKTEKIHYGFFASFPAGIRMGWETLVSYVKQFRLVFTKAGAKSLGGFGAIGNLFPKTWDWTIFWSMTALLSVILAFMNILPIPVLDGGYIMFILYELLTGKKPSDKAMELLLNIGMILLLMLLVYANGNDIVRWVTGKF